MFHQRPKATFPGTNSIWFRPGPHRQIGGGGRVRVSRDRMDLTFSGAEAGTEPLTWGEKAILQDMRDSGNQFSMGGRLALPAGGTVADAATRVTDLVRRHTALRVRLGTDGAGRLIQDIAGEG